MLAIYVEELTKKYPQISVTFFDANAFLQPVSVSLDCRRLVGFRCASLTMYLF